MDKKIAVVTGASRGIGAAIAKKLAADGCFVVVNYNGSEEKAQAVVDEIVQAGGEAKAVRCNVADEADCKEFITGVIKEYSRVDVLVNNAGITKDGLVMAMSDENFDSVYETNLKGTFHTIKNVTRQMLKQRSGKIINMASVVGITGNAGQANYAASKAGVIALTKSVAKELGSRGICVNAIAPGFIQTDMTDKLSDEVKSAIGAQIALGHFGNPEDVANAVSFLASDSANYITGQVLAVDGGMT